MKKLLLSLSSAILSLGIATLSSEAEPQKMPPSGRQFSREEYMVMNLDRGADSTGAHLAESLKDIHAIVRDLDKSLRQLQQVDKEFARSKGKPDDRFLGNAGDRLQQALTTAQQLEKELTDSRNELRDNIHQALIMAQ